jgi:hypothetical protein
MELRTCDNTVLKRGTEKIINENKILVGKPEADKVIGRP